MLPSKVGFKGYGLKPEEIKKSASFTFNGKDYSLK